MSCADRAQQILDWVRSRSRHLAAGEISLDTPLIRDGVITSLQVTELIHYIEQLRGRPVDVTQLAPATFQSVASIAAVFFGPAAGRAGSHER